MRVIAEGAFAACFVIIFGVAGYTFAAKPVTCKQINNFLHIKLVECPR